MAGKRMLWQLYPSYLFITLASVIAVVWYTSATLRSFYLEEVASDLEARARLVETSMRIPLAAAPAAAVDSLSKELGANSDTRITVILPTGEVIGDSDEDPGAMDNHKERPEVAEALAGKVGSSLRYSNTLNRMLMYVAIPVAAEDSVVAVVRTAIPVTALEAVIASLRQRILLVALLIAAVAAAISLYASRKISRPLEKLKLAAQRFAGGDLERRVTVSGSDELKSLATAMNQMAEQLDDRIRAVTNQSNLQEAILSSMSEGVIAIDSDQRVINLNRAAADMIGVNELSAKGRPIQEIVRSTELRRLVSSALTGSDSVEGDIVFRRDGERFVQGHGTVLRDAAGARIGVLVVLNDVTRLKKLERVRRDFVANVSHELKTPITSIKGFVETLLDSTFEDAHEAERFLKIVSRQTDRLNAIIEDLLSLSRIEQEAEKLEVAFAETNLRDILASSIQACESRASAKNISIELDCDEQIRARVNAPLIEQAVTNLIDNAVKYSDDDKEVRVTALVEDDTVAIQVRDRGIGIAEEHIPRIFERFYRVDRGRSRRLGGTGLGLAIAKHIALAHGGQITVTSKLQEGTTFTISLPQKPPAAS